MSSKYSVYENLYLDEKGAEHFEHLSVEFDTFLSWDTETVFYYGLTMGYEGHSAYCSSKDVDIKKAMSHFQPLYEIYQNIQDVKTKQYIIEVLRRAASYGFLGTTSLDIEKRTPLDENYMTVKKSSDNSVAHVYGKVQGLYVEEDWTMAKMGLLTRTYYSRKVLQPDWRFIRKAPNAIYDLLIAMHDYPKGASAFPCTTKEGDNWTGITQETPTPWATDTEITVTNKKNSLLMNAFKED